MDNEKVKEVLLRYGHWMGLGAAVLVIAVTFFISKNVKAEKGLKQVRGIKKKISVKMRPTPPPTESLPDYLALMRRNWKNTFEVTAAPGQDSFYPAAKHKFVHEPPPDELWINSPSDLELNVGRESISLSWESPSVLTDEKGNERQMTSIDGYQLVKEWKDKRSKKKRRKIFSLGEDETSFDDEKVETRVVYEYKLRAYSMNTKAKGGSLTKFNNKDVVVSEYTDEKNGEILPLYKIKLLGVAGNTAFLELEKWEKGDWRRTTCRIKKGTKIEAKAVIKGIDEIVHFNPGWTLVNLATKIKRISTSSRKVVARDKEGNILFDERKRPRYEIVKERRPYYTPGVKYRDEKGDVITLYPNTKKK